MAPVLARLVPGVDAAVVGNALFLQPRLREIADLMMRRQLPSIGDPQAGFLLNYSVDFRAVARKGAQNVARVLGGTRPSELPVEQMSEFELTVNQGTADAIGLKIPPALLMRASKVLRS